MVLSQIPIKQNCSLFQLKKKKITYKTEFYIVVTTISLLFISFLLTTLKNHKFGVFFQRRKIKATPVPQFPTHPSSHQPHDSFESSDCTQPAMIEKVCHLVQRRGKHGRHGKRASRKREGEWKMPTRS